MPSAVYWSMLLRGKQGDVLHRDGIHLMRKHLEGTELANRGHIPELVLGDRQRLPVLGRVDARKKNLLVNHQAIEVKRIAGRVQLDTLHVVTVVILEVGVGGVTLLQHGRSCTTSRGHGEAVEQLVPC